MGICESILWKLEMSLIRPLVHCEVSLLENLDGYLVSVNPMPPLPRGCPPLAFFFFLESSIYSGVDGGQAGILCSACFAL